MKRLACALVLIVAVLAPAAARLAVPTPAGAASFPPRLNFAYSLALGYWGQTPTACASIDKQVVPAGALAVPGTGFAISGRASEPPPDAPPDAMPCILWIDRAYAEPIIFDLLCAVMVHNVGHLLGMAHSANPRSVMHEDIPVPRLCEVKGRQATRLYMLQMKLHWLQKQRRDWARRMLPRARREVSRQARRFWSPYPVGGVLSTRGTPAPRR